MYKKPLI